MPTFAVSSPWKKQVFCYCMVSLTRLFYRSSPSLNEVFLFTIFLVVTAQQTYLFPSLLIQLYPIVLFQLSPLHFTLSLTYSDFASLWDSVLVPDLQKAIPWSCAAGHPIRCHADTAHSVVMTRQHSCKRQTRFYYRYFCIWYVFYRSPEVHIHSCISFQWLTHSLRLKRVPDVAVEVVVPSEDESSREGGSDGSHSAHDAGVLVRDELLVWTQVIQLAGSVVWTCDHCIAIGEKLKSDTERKMNIFIIIYYKTHGHYARACYVFAVRSFERLLVCWYAVVRWFLSSSGWLLSDPG